MRRKIAVTGGGGFIGGHLVGALLAQGHEVRCVDRKPAGDWLQVHEGAENVVADLQGIDACMAACKGVDECYQLAADMGGMGFIENNKALCMLSVLINTHMLLAAREHGLESFFYSSSACVYNVDKQKSEDAAPLREADAYPAKPEDGYGWEKLFSGADVPPFQGGLRAAHQGGPLPQRVRTAWRLGWRQGKSACGDMPQGGPGQTQRQARYRDLGRRQADTVFHVH